MTTPGRDTYRWRQIRAAIRAATGLCPRCGQPLQPALQWPHPLSTTAGHIIPVVDAPTLADNPSNVRAEHLACNSADGARITNSRRRGQVASELITSPDWT